MKKRQREFPKTTLKVCRKEIVELISKLEKNHESEDEKEILSRAKIWEQI